MAGTIQEESDELTRARMTTMAHGAWMYGVQVVDVMLGQQVTTGLGTIMSNLARGPAGPLDERYRGGGCIRVLRCA